MGSPLCGATRPVKREVVMVFAPVPIAVIISALRVSASRLCLSPKTPYKYEITTAISIKGIKLLFG